MEEIVEKSQEYFDLRVVDVSRRNLVIDLLIGRIQNKELDLSPDFRLQMDIWDDGTQSRLIESLLIGIPIPAFYFDASEVDEWQVIDGVQRLTALARFVMSEQDLEKLNLKKLVLCDLEYLIGLNGKTFEALERGYMRRLLETQVTAYTIESGLPAGVKYNIFKRVNTNSLKYNYAFRQR